MKALGKGYKDLTKDEKEKIIELFSKGKRISEIIKEIKTTKRAVPQVLKDANIYTLRKNRYTLNEDYFENIDSPEKSYWLGMIASDGCITETNYIVLALNDTDVLEKFKEDIEYTGEIYLTVHRWDGYERNPTYRINFSSKKMCNDLRNAGIHEKKSLTFNDIPEILPKEYIRDFIRGYFDGDGCIRTGKTISHWRNKRYEYITWAANIIATSKMCIKLKEILDKELNYNCPIHTSKTLGMEYTCIYGQQTLKKFYEYMYKDATRYMLRKYNKWQEFLSALAEKSARKNKKEMSENSLEPAK
jgi:intron-encoded putative endonuclease